MALARCVQGMTAGVLPIFTPGQPNSTPPTPFPPSQELLDHDRHVMLVSIPVPCTRHWIDLQAR